MKKFIISEEERSRILNLHEGFKKDLINEEVSDYTGSQYYTKVEGPFKDVAYVGTGDVYIMKLEKTLCRYTKTPSEFYNKIYVMTGTTCGEEYTTIPGGKFYIQQESEGKITSFHRESRYYVNATNNGQGYNTVEEAKKGISILFNPKGSAGRQVLKGTNDIGEKYKQVTKYDKEGNVQKSKTKITTATGNKSVEKLKSNL
jgi:hypothetical protein